VKRKEVQVRRRMEREQRYRAGLESRNLSEMPCEKQVAQIMSGKRLKKQIEAARSEVEDAGQSAKRMRSSEHPPVSPKARAQARSHRRCARKRTIRRRKRMIRRSHRK